MYENNLRHVVFVLSSVDGEKNRVNNVRNVVCLGCYIIVVTEEKRKNSRLTIAYFKATEREKYYGLFLTIIIVDQHAWFYSKIYPAFHQMAVHDAFSTTGYQIPRKRN